MVILPIRAPCGRVELRGDLAVTMALESDPTVKRSLGGPLERATVARVHRQRLERMARSDLFFTIAVDDLPRTARRRRALTDSIAFVVHTTVRISTSKARNGTNSAHASVHSRMIAGYQRSHLSENSAKRSDAAWSEEAV